MAEAVLDVGAWLADGNCYTGVDITRPAEVGCWTRSAGAGCRQGDRSGLHAYAPPSLPAPLDSAAVAYTAQHEDEACGVELVIQAAAEDGPAALARAGVVTFRNNLSE